MATQTVQRHPLRGAGYGVLLGIGIAIYLVLFAVTPFRISTIVIVVVITAIVGALWGAFAPAKRPALGSPAAVELNELHEEEQRSAARHAEDPAVTTAARLDDAARGDSDNNL